MWDRLPSAPDVSFRLCLGLCLGLCLASSMLLSACQHSAGPLPEIITVRPDPARPAQASVSEFDDAIHFDLGQGRKTAYSMRVSLGLSQPFGIQSLYNPSNITHFKVYVVSGNSGTVTIINNGGPFTVAAGLGAMYPQARAIVFDNVPGPSSPVYYVAASAYNSSLNITGNGPRGGYVQVNDGGLQDAFVSVGGGNNVTDIGEIQVGSPFHDVMAGHQPTLLIFMTLE